MRENEACRRHTAACVGRGRSPFLRATCPLAPAPHLPFVFELYLDACRYCRANGRTHPATSGNHQPTTTASHQPRRPPCSMGVFLLACLTQPARLAGLAPSVDSPCTDAPAPVVRESAAAAGRPDIASCEHAAAIGLCSVALVQTGCPLSCGVPCQVQTTARHARRLAHQPRAKGLDNTHECCSNNPSKCAYPADGECDDGGPGSEWSGCVLGTDCSDCGDRCIPSPPPAPPSPPSPPFSPPVCCSEACGTFISDNGICDDGGPGAEYDVCPLGTDCKDCGNRCPELALPLSPPPPPLCCSNACPW